MKIRCIPLYILFFFVLCTFAQGIGLGISPTSIELKPGEEKTVWLSNPNKHSVQVILDSDCDDVEIEDSVFKVDANSALGVVLIAASETDGCNASLSMSIAKKNNSAGLLPSIQIPLIVLHGRKNQDTYDEIPNNMAEPHFPKAATIAILSTMICLTLIVCVKIYSIKRLVRKGQKTK